MRLDQATELIKTCAEQMNARYKKFVFDEWAAVSLAGCRARVMAYFGPRPPLRSTFLNSNPHIS